MRSTALLTVGSGFVINGLSLLLVVIVREEGGSATLIGIMLGIGAGGDVLGLSQPRISGAGSTPSGW